MVRATQRNWILAAIGVTLSCGEGGRIVSPAVDRRPEAPPLRAQRIVGLPDLGRACGGDVMGAAFDGSYYYVADRDNCISRFDPAGALVDHKRLNSPYVMTGLHYVPGLDRLTTRLQSGHLYAIDYHSMTLERLTTFNIGDFIVPTLPSPVYESSIPAVDPEGWSYWTLINELDRNGYYVGQRVEERRIADGALVTSFRTANESAQPMTYPVHTGVAVSNDALFVFSGQGVNVYDKATGDSLGYEPLALGWCWGGMIGASASGDRVLFHANCSAARVEWVTIGRNAPPVARFFAPPTALEGAMIHFDGSPSSDADGDDLTYTWLFGDGAEGSDAAQASHSYRDDGVFDVTLTVTDTEGLSGAASLQVAVANVAPTILGLAGPPGPIPINAEALISGMVLDPGEEDAQVVIVDWGDGTVSQQSLGAAAGGIPFEASHSYSTSGVFSVVVHVSDDDGGASSATLESFVVVFDSQGGFVTGGGWMDSPSGAYPSEPLLVGRASFGFVSKYQAKKTVPTGNVEFHFAAGSLDFKSDQFEWLVVNKSDSRAQFKGVGEISGASEYHFMFMVWAEDSPDRVRIRVWRENPLTGEETVVYDNGLGTGQAQMLGGGSIQIHAP